MVVRAETPAAGVTTLVDIDFEDKGNDDNSEGMVSLRTKSRKSNRSTIFWGAFSSHPSGLHGLFSFYKTEETE